MIMTEYLKYKDCAKILYDLYESSFNCLERTFVSMEVPQQQIERYKNCCEHISLEEIWAYMYGIIVISSLNLIETKREWNFEKRRFLDVVISPLLKEFRTNETVDEFIVQNDLCKGLDKNWIFKVSEYITKEEAKIIVGNIKKFLKK